MWCLCGYYSKMAPGTVKKAIGVRTQSPSVKWNRRFWGRKCSTVRWRQKTSGNTESKLSKTFSQECYLPIVLSEVLVLIPMKFTIGVSSAVLFMP